MSSGGIFCATKFCGDGSCLTGINAGFDPDAQENLYAGTGAGAASDSDTCFNIALGCYAGNDLNSGDYNVFLGNATGQAVTSGTGNIFLGRDAGYCTTDGGCVFAAGFYAASVVIVAMMSLLVLMPVWVATEQLVDVTLPLVITQEGVELLVLIVFS